MIYFTLGTATPLAQTATPLAPPPDMEFKQISASGDNACGVVTTGEVFCWSAHLVGYDSPKPVQIHWSAKQVTLSGAKACVVTDSKAISCTTDIYNSKWKPIAGGLDTIDLDGDRICGTIGHDIYCGALSKFLARKSGYTWQLLGGYLAPDLVLVPDLDLVQVSVSGSQACVVNKRNQIFCSDDIDNAAGADWKIVPGLAKQVEVKGPLTCVVTLKNEVACAPFKTSDWNKSTFKDIEYIAMDDKQRVYGINKDKKASQVLMQ
eukprot:NODE_50_length_27150_cov_0.307308.p9 type:complete len:263 gc:universal NODE_50_length_27150_cov_0.307308:20621-19833(-)